MSGSLLKLIMGNLNINITSIIDKINDEKQTNTSNFTYKDKQYNIYDRYILPQYNTLKQCNSNQKHKLSSLYYQNLYNLFNPINNNQIEKNILEVLNEDIPSHINKLYRNEMGIYYIDDVKLRYYEDLKGLNPLFAIILMIKNTIPKYYEIKHKKFIIINDYWNNLHTWLTIGDTYLTGNSHNFKLDQIDYLSHITFDLNEDKTNY